MFETLSAGISRTQRQLAAMEERGRACNDEAEASSWGCASPARQWVSSTCGASVHSLCGSMEESYRHGCICVVTLIIKAFRGKKSKGNKDFLKSILVWRKLHANGKPWHLIDFNNHNDIVFSFRLCSGPLKLWEIDRQVLVRGNENGF